MAQRASSIAAAGLLQEKLSEIVDLLGLDSAGGLIRSWSDFSGTTNRHIVRQAFETIGVNSVFGFTAPVVRTSKSFTPIVYLAIAEDTASAKELHRLVWSQGVVPHLLIATPAGLEVRRGLAPPPTQPTVISWSKIGTSTGELPVELTSLTAISLRSSIVWRDFAIDRASRVDKALLDGIVQLSHTVQQENLALERSVIHAVIGRFMYFYILLDRGIIDDQWVADLHSDHGTPLCPTVSAAMHAKDGYAVWPAAEVWALFDQIDAVMNGAIFPVTNAQRVAVGGDTLHLVHRVIRHGDQVGPGGRQLSFLDVSFGTLRTETISAIYELFLALESEDEKSDDGAFYTPPFLVDYVLDEIDRVKPFGRSSRVLDPAAGSGIFLVGAFRRMLERTLPEGKWTARHFMSSRKLLENGIFGIERNAQAANVCRFSLYLTLLDYISGFNIVALAKMARGTRVFPPLAENVLSRDVFEVPGEGPKAIGRFTHVVGNPPWGSFGDSASRTNEQRSEERQEKITQSMTAASQFNSTLDGKAFPVANKRLSELFIWKIKRDLLAPDGALGILISTRSFVSRSASAFPSAMASQFQLFGIANLSHFRYRLFAEARSPTIAVFALNSAPDPMDKVWVYAPLLSSQPIGEKGHLWSIIVNSSDVETHRLRDLTKTPDGWFDHLILRPLDRRYARHLQAWTDRTSQSLGDFLQHFGLRMLRGGSPQQTGLPSELLLKADYRQVLGLDGFGPGSYRHDQLSRHALSGHYAKLFSGNVLLIPRSMNDVVYVKEPVGFSSTFNAIYYTQREAGPGEQKLLAAMASYLMSDVAHYFYALVGKSWILDHARLEKHDLQTVPFPVKGTDDPALETLSNDDQTAITALIAERMGLDRSFVAAVQEYKNFRSGYEDSQLPASSLQAPSSAEIGRYKAMLDEQLSQAFGSKSETVVNIDEAAKSERFARIAVSVGRKGTQLASGAHALPQDSAGLGQFNPYSVITFYRAENIVAVTKPWTHVAWTIEQAFTDARGISAAILRSETAN